ncbi:DDE Tnp4 domain-containing protein [Abeliophyllum distichum]|uniref:DDE Tnp4 domain-containing protein n=1 Tax=Abeliophyllum distichum TaxID=126358 RepID=A0ABD1TI45_9LAMI
MVIGCDTSHYRILHGTISQNILPVCNFDLEFVYMLSGWKGYARDSKALSDALSRNNELEVPQGRIESGQARSDPPRDPRRIGNIRPDPPHGSTDREFFAPFGSGIHRVRGGSSIFAIPNRHRGSPI